MTLLTFRLIFLSVTFTLLLAPIGIRLAPRFGLMDVPGSLPHKRHKRAVPLVGGWVIALATVVLAQVNGFLQSQELVAILAASSVVFAFGVWDDLRGLSAPVKLVGQGAGAVLLIQLGITVRLFDPALDWLNLLITTIWLVGVTNAYNFVDSMDGLAAGLSGLTAAFLMLVTFDSGQEALSNFSTLLLGGCIGAFFFNSRPAKIFLGDTGAQWLGFTLSALAIAYTPQGFLRTQSWFLPILLVGVPIFDTTLVVFSRIRRRQPVYKASFDHTYHRLVKFGMSKDRAVLCMHLTALLLGCLAFVGLSLPPVWGNTLFAALLLSSGLLLIWMDHPVRWPREQAHE